MGSNLYKNIKIKGLETKGNLFLAPAAGYSDAPFRSICTQMGSSLNFTEMVSCEAIIRNNHRTFTLMESGVTKGLNGIQIFTGNPESAKKSIKNVLKFKPSIIDLNCGCPVPKILKSGSGSALMKNPKKIKDIVRAINDETDTPVSIKIRSGFTNDDINYLDCALMAIEGGASLISIHPRTRTQGYSGVARWQDIKDLKDIVNVPVIGSGDLYSPYDAQRMLTETGCDGVMFARGSFGNPQIFTQTIELLTTGNINTTFTMVDKLKIAQKHFNYALDFYNNSIALKEIKKHLCAYTKGITGAKELRDKFMRCETKHDYDTIFNSVCLF